MKNLLLITATLLISLTAYSQGYLVGDIAMGFTLKNVDGKMVSLSDFKNDKGVILIFTCNHCPYAVAYQDRIIALDKEFKPKGYPVVAINPNDATQYPEDSYENMITRAKEKGFTFPYLYDEKQEVYPVYGATRTPHVYVLKNTDKGFVVSYIGAIDNNYQDATAVTEKYVENAVDNLLAGKSPDPSFTKAIGCSIKAKKM